MLVRCLLRTIHLSLTSRRGTKVRSPRTKHPAVSRMARDIGWSDMKKQYRLQFLAVTAAWLLSTLGAFNTAASNVVPLDLDQIAAGAQHIVHVRCTNNVVQPDAAIGVVTVTTFVVLD